MFTAYILALVILLVIGWVVGRRVYYHRAFKSGKVKLCPHCGRYYGGNLTYCPHCGEVVAKWSSRR